MSYGTNPDGTPVTAEQALQRLLVTTATLENSTGDLRGSLAEKATTISTLEGTIEDLQRKLHALETSVTTDAGRAQAPSTSLESSKEPKLKEPDVFDGAKNRAWFFLASIQLIISSQPSRFTTDEKKILYCASFLRGAAFKWFSAYLRRYEAPESRSDENRKWLYDWGLFTEKLLATWGDPDVKATDSRQLMELRMTSTAAVYAADFRRLAASLSWNDEVLRFLFEKGLTDYIKDTITALDTTFTSLDDLIHKAISIDNCTRIRDMERSDRPSSNHRHCRDWSQPCLNH
jgi:Retrotransposon gag protein